MSPAIKIVVTDSNVLINLMHTNRLESFAKMPGFEFVVPDHVQQEISDPAQKARLAQAIAQNLFALESITETDDLSLFADLIVHVGRGEAACLVIAKKKGWLLASDEKRRFQREAETHIGLARLLRTQDIYVLAIKASLLTVAEADQDKTLLEQKRFKMSFVSFQELLP